MSTLPIDAIAIGERRREDYRKKPIPEAIRWAVWERDDFTCLYCRARRYLSVDHVRPERHGGNLSMENLVTVCQSCNSRKGTMGLAAFLDIILREKLARAEELDQQIVGLARECANRFGVAPMVSGIGFDQAAD